MIAHKVLTITLNPAIDQTAFIHNFHAGEVNRVEFEQSDAAGKGVNVASYLSDFGFPVTVTGFLGADNAEFFQRFFAEKKIEDQFIRVAGKTRVNIKLVDSEKNQTTDLNFPGARVENSDMEPFLRMLELLVHRSQWVVVSGSLPAGVPTYIYRDIVKTVKVAGRTVLLDASGESFRLALEAAPAVIKPNVAELREATGASLESEEEIVQVSQDLVYGGIESVIVSMGVDGAIFIESDASVLARPPRMEVKSTVGAGDAMVAGYLVGRMRNYSLEDCARIATAFAMGAVTQIGPRLPAMNMVESYTGKVVIGKL